MAVFYSPVEVVGAAIETERSGRQYYEAASVAAQQPKIKGLFEYLAGEEAKHERTFQGLFNRIKEGPAALPNDWSEVAEYLKVITDSRFFLTPDKALALADSARNERDALEFALQFEKETLLFYLELDRLIAAEHRAVVEELAAQERIHIRRLSEMRMTLTEAVR